MSVSLTRARTFNRDQPISPKQVQLLLTRARQAGLKGEAAVLEWIEYDAGLGQYFRIEDFPMSKFSLCLDKLSEVQQ